MRLIIAGGRAYKGTNADWTVLERLHALYHFSEVFTGQCTGADQFGALWAEAHEIPVRPFPADWDTHGKSAGPIRNREMAKAANACICFPGGKGTDSMAYEAKKCGLLFWDLRGRT